MFRGLLFRIFVLAAVLARFGSGKIHHLPLRDDTRTAIEISDFAYLRGAYFNVEISNFTTNIPISNILGFTFSKGNAMEETLKTNPQQCPLMPPNIDGTNDNLDDVIFFRLNFANKSLDIVRQGPSVAKFDICSLIDMGRDYCRSDFDDSATVARAKDQEPAPTASKPSKADKPASKSKNETEMADVKKPEEQQEKNMTAITTTGKVMKRTARSRRSPEKEPTGEDEGKETFPVSKPAPLLNSLPLVYENKEYYTKFSIRFWHAIEEGEYYFYFHNCYNYKQAYNEFQPVTFSISIVEKNVNSYLPAGEIIKPKLYSGLAALFLATAVFWVYALRSSRDNVYRIHYLMTALVFIKALSLFFHGVNFYFISTLGRQQEAWAVVYYIMHLLKGALLFGTIILIGTGWTFFKNFLTDRDRRLFMVIIPLQVIDNIALIIILESEEGERSYRFWWQLFILVDLLCCAAIILPVIWSIRHLQEASQTDGKAAFNLQKLKLFRHFYIIIIIYIYTTRILRYLISFVVPFQYEWLLVVVEEVGTWFFFVVTGYKFRPAVNNPYLRLAQSDDEDNDTALTQSGALENVVRVNPPKVGSSGRSRKGKRDEVDEQETGLLAEHSLEHD